MGVILVGWYPKACPVCIGDLYDDVMDKGWVTCMMCARSFVPGDVLAVQRMRRPVALREQTPTTELLAS